MRGVVWACAPPVHAVSRAVHLRFACSSLACARESTRKESFRIERHSNTLGTNVQQAGIKMVRTAKSELIKRYDKAESKLRPEDYIGNVKFCPFSDDEQYFSYLFHKDTPVFVLDQLNADFDIAKSLTVKQRLTDLHVRYQHGQEPILTRVFARIAKGKLFWDLISAWDLTVMAL